MIQDGIRIAAASVSGMAVGAFYYNPTVNPLAKVWFTENYPNITLEQSHQNLNENQGIPLAGSMLCVILLSTFVNQYVNQRQVAMGRMIQMAVELTLMVACLQLPHTLFASQSVKAWAVDQVHNFLVVTVVSVVLGYRRDDTHIST